MARVGWEGGFFPHFGREMAAGPGLGGVCGVDGVLGGSAGGGRGIPGARLEATAGVLQRGRDGDGFLMGSARGVRGGPPFGLGAAADSGLRRVREGDGGLVEIAGGERGVPQRAVSGPGLRRARDASGDGVMVVVVWLEAQMVAVCSGFSGGWSGLLC